MSSKTYYDILEINKDATQDEIKKSYRRLSLQYHPDRNSQPDAKDKIRDINTAYETLCDKETRHQYDQQLNGFGGGGNGFSSGPTFFRTSFNERGEQVDIGNIGNIFQSLFGNGGAGVINPEMFHQHIFQQMNKPPPIITNISISLTQSYNGCVVPVEINKWIVQQNNAAQRQTVNETILVTIPEGVCNGEIIILRERGNTVNDLLKGDIKIIINIVKETGETEFEMAGVDLLRKHSLSLKESLCGFVFNLKHLNGSNYCIKNTTTIVTPGQKQVIPKLGMKKGGIEGNLIIEYNIIFPTTLSDSAKKTLGDIL
jgi:DnaJ-class molecular chaperone